MYIEKQISAHLSVSHDFFNIQLSYLSFLSALSFLSYLDTWISFFLMLISDLNEIIISLLPKNNFYGYDTANFTEFH